MRTPLWTTKGPTGIVHWSSTGLHLTRREAIAAFRSKDLTSWPTFRKMGYRAIQVRVTEVKP